jgi:hypothetical protein
MGAKAGHTHFSVLGRLWILESRFGRKTDSALHHHAEHKSSDQDAMGICQHENETLRTRDSFERLLESHFTGVNL